ncbi:hypothetical protein DSECCO2_471490 [anaerobic digester metagenome]
MLTVVPSLCWMLPSPYLMCVAVDPGVSRAASSSGSMADEVTDWFVFLLVFLSGFGFEMTFFAVTTFRWR